MRPLRARWRFVPFGLLGALFVVTGATGLLVEQIFEKFLTTVVGSATTAGAIVLSVFFAGLSLGGVAYGAMRRRISNPFILYAVLEGIVGLDALALGVFSSPIQRASASLVHLGGQSALALFVLRIAVAAMWILPPTIAMGATYPTIVGVLRGLGTSAVQPVMARYYALNLAGAFVGSAVAPNVLFPKWGLDGTLFGIAATQALVAVLALSFRRAAGGTAGSDVQAAEASPAPAAATTAHFLRSLVRSPGASGLVAVAALSGFATFSFEVLWLHLVGAVLGMSVYAFALMLAVVLLGLFVGGSLVSALSSIRVVPKDAILPFALTMSAVCLAWTCGSWDAVPEWLVKYGRPITEFDEAERLRFSIALRLVGVPSVALGMVYPSLFQRSRFSATSAWRNSAGSSATPRS